MATKYWRGGAYTDRGHGTAVSDGDWNEDDSGGGNVDSNWVNAAGTGVAKPLDGDEIIFSGLAGKVPADYSNANYPHEVGKCWSVCANMDQDLIDSQNIVITETFDGNIYQYRTKAFDALAAEDSSGDLRIRCANNSFVAGGWATLTGTTYHNGEYRIKSVDQGASGYIVVDKPYSPETFAATAAIVERTPLRITVQDTYQITMKGTGIVYIECSDDASGGDNIPQLVFDSTSGYLHISSDKWSDTVYGDWNDVLVMGAGTLKIGKDSCVDNIKVTADSTATILAGMGITDGSAGGPTDFTFDGGTISWDSKLGTGTMAGGTLTFCNNPLMKGTQADIESLTIYGGTFKWYGKSDMDGYEQWGGTITAYGDQDKTFGSGATTEYQHYGGTLDLSQTSRAISLGSNDTIKHWGGNFYPSKDTVIEWT